VSMPLFFFRGGGGGLVVVILPFRVRESDLRCVVTSRYEGGGQGDCPDRTARDGHNKVEWANL
jgi:hypothetical protein